MVRVATVDDAPACAAIYAPYVTDTVISFELEPPDAREMARRISAAHEWLVIEEAGREFGYAYAGEFARRAACQWATEVSVYVEMGRRRTGAGRPLYSELLPRLADRGLRQAIVG